MPSNGWDVMVASGRSGNMSCKLGRQIAVNEDDSDETRLFEPVQPVRPVLARLGSLISSSSKIHPHHSLGASLPSSRSYLTFITAALVSCFFPGD